MKKNKLDLSWKTEYEELAEKFLKKHFGSSQGLTESFPSMRKSYPWGKGRPPVVDSRVLAKNNDEYHGLEKHAKQYHVTAQYYYAYQHWIIAAYWRRQDMIANNVADKRHEDALKYAIKNAFYNKALFEWQKTQGKSKSVAPLPEEFGLKASDIDNKDRIANSELDNAYKK